MKKKILLKKKILVIILAAIMIVAGGCVTTSSAKMPPKGTVKQSAVLFPRPQNAFVGDPILFYDNGKMNVFYIHDSRVAYGQFHPWHLYQTQNFYDWEDKGNVIPSDGKDKQDWGIGTGSVVKDKNGLYHAFYTGWNGLYENYDLPFNEKVQHATSTDLVNWTKHYEDGFYGGNNEFRDPHVVYVEEDGKYWMIVSTFVSATNSKPILRLYKSSDLKTWENHGTFFDDESDFMECPTLFNYNGYWYLSYFQKAPDGTNGRVVRYLYKKNLSDNWIRGDIDYIDGAGFSSGKFEKFGDRLMAIGWLGTKTADYDGGEFTWAGNLVTHEIKQNANGTLYPIAVKEVVQKINTEVKYEMTYFSKGANYKDNTVTFGQAEEYQYLLFEDLAKKPTKMNFVIEGGANNKFGLTFGRYGKDSVGELSILFDLTKGTIEFYNKAPKNISGSPQTMVKIKKADKYTCTALLENECFTIYVNGEIALSTRMYSMPEKNFGFFSNSSGVKISDLHFYE